MVNVDKKTQAKNYYKAYLDKQKGTTYADIAKKYKVSTATVNSWQTRHWSKWDNASNADNNESITQNNDLSMQSNDNNAAATQGAMQESAVKLDVDKVSSIVPLVVQKQISETSPDSLLAYDEDYWSKLNDRQRRFVKEYLIDRIGTSAAIRSGYPPSNAAWTASKLLAEPNIASCIAKAEAERDRRTGLNSELIDIELARMLRVNPVNVVDLKTGEIMPGATEDDLAAIQSVKVKPIIDKFGEVHYEREVRFVAKDRITELAMKRHNMLIERKQIDVTTKVEEMSDDDRRKRIADLQKQIAIDVESVRVE